MRRFIPALEAEQVPTRPMLSLEEEQMDVAEATAEVAEITSDLAEVERVMETSDALEDIAVIADGIKEATPTEVALIETAGQALSAGTDIPPEELVPAMESYIGKKIATESLRETARSILAKIMAFLAEIWKKIEGFFYRIMGQIPSLRKAIAALEDRVEHDLKDKKLVAGDKIKIMSGIRHLSVDYKAVANEADIKKALVDLEAGAKTVYGSYADMLVSWGDTIAKSIDGFDAAKAGTSATDLRTKLESALGGAAKTGLPVASTDTARYPGYKTVISKGLLGNVSLAAKMYVDNKDTSDLGALDRMRHGGMELIHTSDKAPTEVKDVEIVPMSVAGMKDTLKSVLAILDILEEYDRGGKFKKIKEMRGKIESASKKATTAMEQARTASKAEERVVVPYYSAMLGFNAAYARWSKAPGVDYMQNALQSIRAVLIVVQKSASAYK